MSEKETKTAGKRKQINVRLTDEEFKMMKEKSKNYPSLSTLVIDAVRAFDDRKGKILCSTESVLCSKIMAFCYTFSLS